MNTKRLVTLAISIAAIAQMSVANAQSEKRSRATNAGWAAIARSGQIALAPPQFQLDQVPAPVAEEIEPQAVDPKNKGSSAPG